MTGTGSITPEILRTAMQASVPTALPDAGLTRAGVLVPVRYSDPSPRLLFTKRTERVETHKGQISFPGGMVESGDRDIIATALREAREEIGVDAKDIEVLGLLDDLATPTGFIITPVVALISAETPLTPNADEVAELFEVPLALFADPATGRAEKRIVRGVEREVWHYDDGAHIIWGATAAIVRSLLRALRMI